MGFDRARIARLRQEVAKLAFITAADAASQGMAGGGEGAGMPMDPSMMGGAPGGMPGGMPMDPAMMGGAPGGMPMDPSMMGAAPGGMPMDPSMMGGGVPGGMPGGMPMDPSMMGGGVPGGMPGGMPMDPSMMGMEQPQPQAMDEATLRQLITQAVRDELRNASGFPDRPKVKSDPITEVWQIKRLLAKLTEALGLADAASGSLAGDVMSKDIGGDLYSIKAVLVRLLNAMNVSIEPDILLGASGASASGGEGGGGGSSSSKQQEPRQ